jgi:hypothetical protein
VRRSRSGVFVSIRKCLLLSFHEIAAIFECGVVSIRFFFASCLSFALEGESPLGSRRSLGMPILDGSAVRLGFAFGKIYPPPYGYWNGSLVNVFSHLRRFLIPFHLRVCKYKP